MSCIIYYTQALILLHNRRQEHQYLCFTQMEKLKPKEIK